ncbi:hypothetical protein, partial [Nostoc sp.]
MGYWEDEGDKLVKLLGDKTEESEIKKICVEVVEKIRLKYPEVNSRKTPLATVRKTVLAAFPDTKNQEYLYQYFTNKGKNNIERYQHLALKYLSLSSEEWDSIGNEARQQWKAKQLEVEVKPETQPKTQPEVKTEINIEDMEINQLGLDDNTQQLVSDAIAHSGISLADFIRKSCTVYANTLLGKAKQKDDDLSGISTDDLLSDKYKTHPGRAEELVKRTIKAIKIYNNNCTEKSQKWHINATIIQVLTGSRQETIKNILEKNHKTEIEVHYIGVGDKEKQ